MSPRYFRATAFLCLAILAADVVVARLPHWHQHPDGSVCEHAHAHSPHSRCSHSHSCGHQRSCSHHHAPAPQQTPPADSDQPCDHCTLCRHQSQAALPVVVVPVSLACSVCAEVPDQQQAQIAGLTPRVYQGRGPPVWL